MNREEVRQFLSRLSRKEWEYIKSMIPADSAIPTPRVLENDTYAIEELREYIQMVSDEVFKKGNPDYDKINPLPIKESISLGLTASALSNSVLASAYFSRLKRALPL
jgi:hypothetical protein